MTRCRLIPLSLLLTALLLPAGFASGEKDPSPGAEARSLTYTDAVILGLVEGITEFLPISSTGHLILSNHFLGLDAGTPALDLKGDPLLARPRSSGAPPEPLTLKAAVDAYSIVIQIGAIAAVLIICWSRVRTMARGLMGRDPRGRLLIRNLLVAFLPAVVLGLLLEDWIDRHLFSAWPVIAALFAGGLLIFAVEWWRGRSGPEGPGPDLHELTWKQSLMIGLLQCVAMWPGTSRSMMTIIGGYLAGLTARRAAEFSFLLGLITLSAAAGYKGLKTGPAMLAAFGAGPLLLGCVVAALSAAVAVKWMVDYLGRHGLGIFGWYRIGLAGVLLALLY